MDTKPADPPSSDNQKPPSMAERIALIGGLEKTGSLSEALLAAHDWITCDPLSVEAFECMERLQGMRGEEELKGIAAFRADQLRQILNVGALNTGQERLQALFAAQDKTASFIKLGGFCFPILEGASPGQRTPQANQISLCGRAQLRYPVGETGSNDYHWVRFLGQSNCPSAPHLIWEDPEGISTGGQPVYIVSYLRADRGGFGVADLIHALLQLQAWGVYPGNPGLKNLRFDGTTGVLAFQSLENACHLADEMKALSPRDYIAWCVEQESERCEGKEERPFLTEQGVSDDRIWIDGRLNLMATSLRPHHRYAHIREAFVQTAHTRRTFLSGNRELTGLHRLFDEIAFKPQERVLEVGSGNGVNLLYFAERDCRVTGFETDKALSCLASSLLAAGGCKAEIFPHDFDFESSELRFDSVFATSVLHHFWYRDKAFKRIADCCERRLFIEIKPEEEGFKWVGRWYQDAPAFQYQDNQSLLQGLANWFPDFALKQDLGPTSQGRSLYLFERKHSPG